MKPKPSKEVASRSGKSKKSDGESLTPTAKRKRGTSLRENDIQPPVEKEKEVETPCSATIPLTFIPKTLMSSSSTLTATANEAIVQDVVQPSSDDAALGATEHPTSSPAMDPCHIPDSSIEGAIDVQSGILPFADTPSSSAEDMVLVDLDTDTADTLSAAIGDSPPCLVIDETRKMPYITISKPPMHDLPQPDLPQPDLPQPALHHSDPAQPTASIPAISGQSNTKEIGKSPRKSKAAQKMASKRKVISKTIGSGVSGDSDSELLQFEQRKGIRVLARRCSVVVERIPTQVKQM